MTTKSREVYNLKVKLLFVMKLRFQTHCIIYVYVKVYRADTGIEERKGRADSQKSDFLSFQPFFSEENARMRGQRTGHRRLWHVVCVFSSPLPT